MQPAYIYTVNDKTAGQIAKDFIRLAEEHSDPIIAASLGAAAAEFKKLVSVRNDLLHANPGTAPSGQQRLFRKGIEWDIPRINAAADCFATLEITLNDHL